MRLIDASKLIRYIDADALIRYIDANKYTSENEKVFTEFDVVEMVNNQPTAYDVDKVVKEINDIVEHCDNRNKICMDVGDFRSADREAEKMCVAIKCREIVKAGGKNE